MTWRPEFEKVRSDFAGRVSPTLSRQETRKLMREVAKLQAAQERRKGRKKHHVS